MTRRRAIGTEAKCRDCGARYLKLDGSTSGRCCNCRGAHRRRRIALDKREPDPRALRSLEALRRYFAGNELKCLLCAGAGRHWRGPGLFQHIVRCHANVGTREYKRRFGIPMTYGLVGAKTQRKLAAAAPCRDMTPARAERARAKVRHRTQWPTYMIDEHMRMMNASPNHPSNLEGRRRVICTQCGEPYEVSAKIALAIQCRAVCHDCALRNRRDNDRRRAA